MSEEEQDKLPDGAESESDQDWGEDWESAFQAEEDLLSEEDLDEDQEADDLDESWDEVLSVSTDTESAPESTEKQPETETPATEGDKPEIKDKSSAGPGLLEKLKAKLSALPVYLKLAVSIVPIAILVAVLLPTFFSRDQETEIILPEEQPVTEKRSTLPAAPEKIRAKWSLTSFFIPVNSDKDPSTVFLNLDLTMILLLDEEGEIPSDDVSRARDLVYQFYNNRPLYELRRFSLARGEMNKKLRNWIRKQWPDIDLETIVFDHYELI